MRHSVYPLIIYIDGSSRGNPGPAGIGVAVFSSDDETKPIHEISRYIGITTNNMAEYEALIHALKYVITSHYQTALIKLDSELVYKQITGAYKIRTAHMAIQHKRIQALKSNIQALSFRLIPRSQNKLANRLAQKASKSAKVTKQTFTQKNLLE